MFARLLSNRLAAPTRAELMARTDGSGRLGATCEIHSESGIRIDISTSTMQDMFSYRDSSVVDGSRNSTRCGARLSKKRRVGPP